MVHLDQICYQYINYVQCKERDEEIGRIIMHYNKIYNDITGFKEIKHETT